MNNYIDNPNGTRTYINYQYKVLSNGDTVRYINHYTKKLSDKPVGRQTKSINSELKEQIKIFRLTNSIKRKACIKFDISLYMLNRYISTP